MRHQHNDRGSTEVVDDLDLSVDFEPCSKFRAGMTDDWQVCASCGWLVDEHGATVTPLRRRAVFPARRAS